jgi:hypothetical protein
VNRKILEAVPQRLLLLVLCELALAGCHQKETATPLVARLEAAGSGDLSAASTDSIQQWLQQHEELALSTKKDCQRIMDSAAKPANWGDTTEGRVCTAALNTYFFHKY